MIRTDRFDGFDRFEMKNRGGGRLRVRKACDACKRRKVKCDGNNPCSTCARHDQECHYDFGSSRKLKYGGNPENRIASLLLELGSNPQLQQQQLAVPAVASAAAEDNSQGGGSGPPYPWQSFSLDKYRFHRRYQNLLPYYLGGSLLSEIPTQTISLYELKRPRIQNYGWNMSGGHFLRHDGQGPKSPSAESPSFFNFDDPIHLSIINKLLKYYFNEINPTLSIIHESKFWKQFENGFLLQGKQKNSKAKLFLSLLYLILAITLRFQEGYLDGFADAPVEYRLDDRELSVIKETRREESMFKYAYSIVTKLTFEWESFELIQSWLLISFYMRTCYRQTACWNALGQAINMCNGMSIYLNRFPRSHSKYDESRAWHCFWACFIMDKLITFQMGRYYQLELPVSHMTVPGQKPSTAGSTPQSQSPSPIISDWFHDETVQLFQLSLIIMKCQNRDGHELGLEESLQVRDELNNWFDQNVTRTKIDKNWSKLFQIQPLLSYLDVRLTFETRRLFLLINRPSDTDEMLFPLDTNALIQNCQSSIEIMLRVLEKEYFFVPWWLNLSQLFTVSVICITLIHSGLRTDLARRYLGDCMHIWQHLTHSTPINPPAMLAECLWCIRMLNQMCCLRLISSATQLELLVGTDPGDSNQNKNKFAQFGKIGEDDADSDDSEDDTNVDKIIDQQQPHTLRSPIGSLPSMINEDQTLNASNLIDDSMFSYLQWFDQNFV